MLAPVLVSVSVVAWVCSVLHSSDSDLSGRGSVATSGADYSDGSMRD